MRRPLIRALLLPKITLLLGTTYRDLHAEREFLLKRTFPELRRMCEGRGVLFSLRETRWPADAAALASRLNKFINVLQEGSTCYLGIRTGFRPKTEGLAVPVSDLPLDLASRINRALAVGTSWQELEWLLARDLSSLKRSIFLSIGEPEPGADTVANSSPQTLSEAIEERLERIIVAKSSGIDPAKARHYLYLKSRAMSALPSASNAVAIKDALQEDQAIVILGESGSGKSTAVGLALETLTAGGQKVVPYVLDGADVSAHSIADHLAASLEQLTSANEAPKADPATQLSLTLSRASDTVIALDGIEYLDRASHFLGWLPSPMPKGVRIVASTTLAEQAEGLEAKGWKVLRSNALDPVIARALIDHLCDERDLNLTPDQKQKIAEHPLSFYPQFLITLLDELSQFGWFAQMHKRLDDHLDDASIYQLFDKATADGSIDSSMPNAMVLGVRLEYYLRSHSLVELYANVLEHLEYDFGAPQVKRVLGYLSMSARGLSLEDLSSLTGFENKSVRQIINALGTNVVMRGQLIQIGNEYIAKAIRSRYVGSAAVAQAVRSSLAFYLRKRTEPHYIEELASQLALGGDRNELAKLLINAATIRGLFQLVPFDTLASYWRVSGEYDRVGEMYLHELPHYLLLLPIESRIHLLRQLADFLQFAGKPLAAYEILQAALGAAAESSSLELDRARIYRSLGKTLYLLSRYSEAEQAYRDAIELLRPTDEYVAELLAAKRDLAQLLGEGARFQEADELYTQLVLDTQGVHGDNSPELASVLNAIGLMLNAQGKYDAAITVAARARNIYVHHWGPEYPELGWCYHVFATANRQKGELGEAAKWYALAIERFVQMHGEEHAIPLRSMYGLAVLLQKKGDLQGAIEQARRVTGLRSKLLGAKHADTAAANVMLGTMLKHAGSLEESMQLLQEGLSVFDTGANKEHPEVARTLHELGEVYGRLGMLPESRNALSRAFAIRSKVLGSDHLDTQATESLMLNLFSSAGGVLRSQATEPIKVG